MLLPRTIPPQPFMSAHEWDAFVVSTGRYVGVTPDREMGEDNRAGTKMESQKNVAHA